MDKTKLTLRNVNVLFANLEDEGFGRSLTIDATDDSVKKQITEWVKTNKIGKTSPGVPNFKEYEGKKQYALKISDFTQFAGLDGLTKENLGFGATVSLIANAFEYDNKFGKGVSGSLSAVVIEKRASTGADADLAELLGKAPDEVVPMPTDDDAPISLDSIPF